MIRNIIFDMGNVLVGFDSIRIAAQFASDPADQQLLLDAIFFHSDWKRLDAGEITDADIYAAIPERLPPRLVQAGIDAFTHWPQYRSRIPEAEPLVDDVKAAGYRTYLLSNASKRWDAYWREVPEMVKLDGHIVSGKVGLVKPDPAIYHLLCKTYALNPAECYLIDDLPANVAAAHDIGMDGFSLTHFQFDELRTDMRAKGIRI
ncbi:MAG: HAD family phosphatase [Clostridia bacterium]